MEKKIIEEDERYRVTETTVTPEDGFVPASDIHGTIGEKDRYKDFKGYDTTAHLDIDVSDGLQKEDLEKIKNFYKEETPKVFKATFTKSNFKKAMIKPLLWFTPVVFIICFFIGKLIGGTGLGICISVIALTVMWLFTLGLYALMGNDPENDSNNNSNNNNINNNNNGNNDENNK